MILSSDEHATGNIAFNSSSFLKARVPKRYFALKVDSSG